MCIRMTMPPNRQSSGIGQGSKAWQDLLGFAAGDAEIDGIGAEFCIVRPADRAVRGDARRLEHAGFVPDCEDATAGSSGQVDLAFDAVIKAHPQPVAAPCLYRDGVQLVIGHVESAGTSPATGRRLRTPSTTQAKGLSGSAMSRRVLSGHARIRLPTDRPPRPQPRAATLAASRSAMPCDRTAIAVQGRPPVAQAALQPVVESIYGRAHAARSARLDWFIAHAGSGSPCCSPGENTATGGMQYRPSSRNAARLKCMGSQPRGQLSIPDDVHDALSRLGWGKDPLMSIDQIGRLQESPDSSHKQLVLEYFGTDDFREPYRRQTEALMASMTDVSRKSFRHGLRFEDECSHCDTDQRFPALCDKAWHYGAVATMFWTAHKAQQIMIALAPWLTLATLVVAIAGTIAVLS